MKYISQINAFFTWADSNNPSDAARNLWHTLMHVANRAGWPERLSIPLCKLMDKSGMSPARIKRARQELVQSGVLQWMPGQGNQSALYRLIPFEEGQADFQPMRDTADPRAELAPPSEAADAPAPLEAQSEAADLCVHFEPQIEPQIEPQTEPQIIPIYRLRRKTENENKKARAHAEDSGTGTREVLEALETLTSAGSAPPECKQPYAKRVLLTRGEFGQLVEEIGEPAARRAIDLLDSYKGAHNKSYASDYLAMRLWTLDTVRRRYPGLCGARDAPRWGASAADPADGGYSIPMAW